MVGRPVLDDLRPDADGILRPAGDQTPFGYADGAEATLLNVLASVSDTGPASAELPLFAADWPTEYHLSPYRWALLDAIDLRGGSVLEIGAGCGAITTWLAERFDRVVAVEGAGIRARVARERCRHVDNVRVVASDIGALEPQPVFDVVTLIGVLEYAPRFGGTRDLPAADAVRTMLETARAWLAPGGALVIAIENQFGLKYLAGHIEDHTARVDDGLEGYRAPGVAVTFSRAGLEEILGTAGFAVDELVLPFPDYKLAETFINARRPVAGAARWLRTPWSERGTGRFPGRFNEGLVAIEAERAGLLADLSNSHLVVARRTDESVGTALDWSVRHYSLGRQPALRKRKTVSGPPDAPTVVVESLADGAEPTAAFVGLGYRQVLDDEAYVTGESPARRVLHLPVDERLAALQEVVTEHAAWLRTQYGARGETSGGPDDLLDPKAYDAGLLNVLVDPEGTWTAIDLEWRAPEAPTIAHVVWRSAHVLLAVWWYYLVADDETRSLEDLATELTAGALGVTTSAIDSSRFLIREELFQQAVVGWEASSTLTGRLAARQSELLRRLEDARGRLAAEQRLRLAAEQANAAATAELEETRALRPLVEGLRSELAEQDARRTAAETELRRAQERAGESAAQLEALQGSRVMHVVRAWWRLRGRVTGRG